MMATYVQAAIKLLERNDSKRALFLLKYIMKIEKGEDVSSEDMNKASDYLFIVKSN